MKKFLAASCALLSCSFAFPAFASETQKMICKSADMSDHWDTIKSIKTDSEFELTVALDPLSVTAVLTKNHTLDSVNLVENLDFKVGCTPQSSNNFYFECDNKNRSSGDDFNDFISKEIYINYVSIHDVSFLTLISFPKKVMYTYACTKA